MRTTAIYTICFLFGALALQAQTRQAYLTAAEDAFDGKDYYSALYYYQTALEFDESQLDILYKAAESARLFNAYATAEKYYGQVIDQVNNGEYPMATFYRGEMLKRLGQYDDAISNYQLFITEDTLGNDYFLEKAETQIQDCRWALDMDGKEKDYITIEHLGDEVNTTFSEFGPYLLGDSLYFSSLRFEYLNDKKQKRITTKPLVSYEGGLDTLDEKGVGNKHVGHYTFSEDAQMLYYTVCDYVAASEIRCDIYMKVYQNGNWSEGMRLPDHINDTSSTNTHPSLGMTPMGDEKALYFVSDRKGGRGKLDIWYATIEADGYGQPMNLGEVNTIEDDITPFYHMPSHTLYFSSEGYQGFGGFDVYSVYFNNGTEKTIENLGMPINSSYNDLYYALTADDLVGYMASNRSDAYYIEEDQQACCNDIYKVDIEELNTGLIAETYEKLSQTELLGATVRLFEVNGANQLIDEQSAENAYRYELPIRRNRSYMLVGEKLGYDGDTVYFDTRNLQSSDTIIKKLFLQSQGLDLELFVFDDETKQALRGATVKLLDLSDPSNEIVLQINEDANNFVFPIERGKSYQIITSKKGYAPDTMNLSTLNVPGNKITRNVYLKRGNLEDFLPLMVFFDNDHPDVRTYRRTTRKTYEQTYPPYYAKKNVFKDLFTEPLLGQAKAEAEDDIDRFFENEVVVGNTDLQRFIEILAVELDKGESLELAIQGFASPLASSQYNKNLSSRRLSSLRNSIQAFEDGRLRQYLQNGSLTLTAESFGEEKAPIYVSDAKEDSRNSVYSVPASRERRIEIVQVTRTKQ